MTDPHKNDPADGPGKGDGPGTQLRRPQLSGRARLIVVLAVVVVNVLVYGPLLLLPRSA